MQSHYVLPNKFPASGIASYPTECYGGSLSSSKFGQTRSGAVYRRERDGESYFIPIFFSLLQLIYICVLWYLAFLSGVFDTVLLVAGKTGPLKTFVRTPVLLRHYLHWLYP